MFIIGRKFCGFYFSHIHAEGFQHAHKSVSDLHAKDSRWLIVFTLKKICLIFFVFIFSKVGVSGT